MIVTRKRRDNFAIVPNAVANDTRLSFEARGLLVYLLAKPQDWTVHIDDIVRQGSADGSRRFGKDKAYALINELRQAGYLHREIIRDAAAKVVRVDYTVYDDAVPDGLPLPLPENPEVGDPLPEKPEMAPDGGTSAEHQPLRALPDTAMPDTAKPDRKNKTESNKNPLSPLFNRLWLSWPVEGRPKSDRGRKKVEKAFSAVPLDQQQHAIEWAQQFLWHRTQIGKPETLSAYVDMQMWREYVGGPRVNARGLFEITPSRPEYPAWVDYIAAKHNKESAEQYAKMLRPIPAATRWPPGYTPPKPATLPLFKDEGEAA